MSIGDLSPDDWHSMPPKEPDLGRQPRTPEWPGLPRAGGGMIATIPAEPELEPLEGKTDRERALDAAWESGYKCASEVLRCKRRDAREAADERRAQRTLIFQLALVATIIVVVLCSTYLLTH